MKETLLLNHKNQMWFPSGSIMLTCFQYQIVKYPVANMKEIQEQIKQVLL